MPFGGGSFSNINYAPTDLTLSNSYIADDRVIGTIIGNFSSSDPNGYGYSGFSYSLVTGIGDTDNASFTIENNQLKTTAPLNYNPNNRYSIRVRTTDSGGLFFEKDLTIYVTDVVISIVASDTNAAETAENIPLNPAILTLSRRGDTNEALIVNYTLGGTATNGTDYTTLPTTVTFAAGSSTATVTVDPIDNLLAEADKTLSLNLSVGNGYAVGTNNTAHVIIADNDRNASSPLIALGAGNSPQISGNNVVWRGNDGTDSEIYFWDGSTITNISNNSTDDNSPQISGNNVVWRNGYYGTNSEIYFWDGSTVTRLTNNSTDDYSPQISGNNVVWTGNDGTDDEIYFWDGSTVTQLTNNSTDDYSPQISGNNVVWYGYNSTGSDIFYFNGNTDNEIYFWNGSTITQLTNDIADDNFPQISGNNVVWQKSGYGPSQVYFWDGSTVTHISNNNSVPHHSPQISGNNVVWQGNDGTDLEIYFWNGSTVTNISNNSNHDYSPQISGNNVVWWRDDWRGDDGIHVWDGSTVTNISNNSNHDYSPQISGNNVVWNRNGQIYLATLTETLETVGNTSLTRGTVNNQLYAHSDRIGTVPINNVTNTAPLTVGLYSDWQVLAAATVNGVNKLLWKNIPGNYLHFWTLDSNWHRLTSGGQWGLNSPEALGLENQFQMDLNGDNLVGIESAGSTFLLKDNQNQLYSQTSQGNITLYNLDSTPLTFSPDDNWQAIAVETTGNTTQLLWKSPSNNLLRLGTLDNNGQHTTNLEEWATDSPEALALESQCLGTLDNNGQHTTNLEEWATDSPEALALESQFQIDLNGDNLTGSPDPILDNLGNTSLVRQGINQLYARTTAGDALIGSLDGTPLRESQYEDWQAVAAETVNGVNQILWKNLSGNFFHLWNQGANWQHVSSIGQWDVNAPEILGLESQFQRDLNGDGVIASPSPVNGG